ncbi:endo-1,4-beta-xylanase [Paenibacillus castaneae]|uniref:glucuronyl esterase domain-containing protein n=1 Tax=Paenibacillus castaneae TaxID=474957 RepID=UPI000C9CC0BF|nr:sugar-binding protein [Paenibacillus castaneae]NIK77789.1 endo-1,4-beta-xylanase [Paenibacillus castaneae]
MALPRFFGYGDTVNAETTVTDNARRMAATFGSPTIGGTDIDSIWNDVQAVVPTIVSKATTTQAAFKTLWDDNALYILAEVTDEVLNSSNSATYQQDSVEVLLDERNDKALSYQSDDLHYRVNYNNFRSSDNGDINRFYTNTRITDTGYIAEIRIALNEKSENGKIMGFELQVNEADASGTRVSTLNVFDKTGNAYANPSLMGEIIFTSKGDGAATGINHYDLTNYLEYVESIDQNVYLNGDVLNAPIAAAKVVDVKADVSQVELDEAHNGLKSAVQALRRSEKFAEPGTLPKNMGLPDPFTFMNGSRVATKADWERRAEELKDMYQFYMYGYMPDASKEVVAYEKNEAGINIKVAVNGKQATFPVSISIPPANNEIKGPYPVIVSFGSLSGAQVNEANQRGYAVVTLQTASIASDSYARTGAFFDLYPYSQAKNDVGALVAWAWGAGKVLDVLYMNAYDAINPDQAIITGFSRWGKAALVTGALDDRFAITNPHASGAGGAASFRFSFAGKQYDWGTAESHEGIGNLQGSTEGHWFSSVFGGITDVSALPFDQHELAALVAPRGLLFTGGYSDWGTNPEGMFVSYVGASKVYDFLKASGEIGFAFRAGSHSRTDEDINNLLDFSDLQLRGIQQEKDFKNSLYVVYEA